MISVLPTPVGPSNRQTLRGDAGRRASRSPRSRDWENRWAVSSWPTILLSKYSINRTDLRFRGKGENRDPLALLVVGRLRQWQVRAIGLTHPQLNFDLC